MRFLIIFSFFINAIFGSVMVEKTWEKGRTLLSFFEDYNIPLKLYYNLSKDDQKTADDIVFGASYYLLYDDKNTITQVVISLGDDLQIHLKKKSDGDYIMEVNPISVLLRTKTLALKLKKSPYNEIISNTGSYQLASEFVHAFKRSVSFARGVKNGDRLVIVYQSKQRLGKSFGSPQIKAAMIEVNKKQNFVFSFGEDNKYYDKNGKEIEIVKMTRPINTRMTSGFSYRRFHPILHIYRPHLGVDYGGPVGTPVRACGDGRVSFVGIKGGYGRVVEINHDGGLKSLYAHLSRFGKIRTGESIKLGTVIGYLGSSGLSTGPHLHFGMYKYNNPIDPNSTMTVVRSIPKKDLVRFKSFVNRYQADINLALKALN